MAEIAVAAQKLMELKQFTLVDKLSHRGYSVIWHLGFCVGT